MFANPTYPCTLTLFDTLEFDTRELNQFFRHNCSHTRIAICHFDTLLPLSLPDLAIPTGTCNEGGRPLFFVPSMLAR